MELGRYPLNIDYKALSKYRGQRNWPSRKGVQLTNTERSYVPLRWEPWASNIALLLKLETLFFPVSLLILSRLLREVCF